MAGDKHAKDNACSSLRKRECPKAQNTMNILCSQSVRARKHLNVIYTVLFGVLKQESLNALRRMYVPRSKIVNSPKHKTQWIIFVLKAWEPKSTKYSMSILFSYKPWIERETRQGQRNVCSSFWKGECVKAWEPNSAMYIQCSSES